MKKLLAFFIGCVSMSVSAHDFWPDDYTVYKGLNGNTMIVTHLRSPDDAYYKFTLNGIPLGKEQLVYPGTVEDFPVKVPNGLIENEKVTICSRRLRSTDQFEQTVCLTIKILE